MDRGGGGYHQPPGWEPDEPPGPERFAPAGKRQLKVRLRQVTMMFPVGSDAEYRWGYRDGTFSHWRAAPNKDMLRAPPHACAVFWRERREVARVRTARKPARKKAG